MPSSAERRRFMEKTMAEMLNVEVCYALPEKQLLVPVKLHAGATLQQALEASGILQKHPEIDIKKNKFGIFAKLSKLDLSLIHI